MPVNCQPRARPVDNTEWWREDLYNLALKKHKRRHNWWRIAFVLLLTLVIIQNISPWIKNAIDNTGCCARNGECPGKEVNNDGKFGAGDEGRHQQTTGHDASPEKHIGSGDQGS